MLSILIPTYNYICTKLVHALWIQATSAVMPFEILVGDDGSTDKHTLQENRKIEQWKNCYFLEHGTNVGRAKIRNWLAEKSQYQFLLFIDSDAEVCRPDFLERYIHTANQYGCVVCGCLENIPRPESPLYSLRYKYEKNADRIRTLTYRTRHPYAQFSTFNFLIPSKIFKDILFDIRCEQYGFEDALFGEELKERGIRIIHIDNPLIHTGIETNDVFLHKTEKALNTLVVLGDDAQRFSHIAQTAKKIRKWHLAPCIKAWHRLAQKYERKNLLGSNPSLLLFNLYKLGYLLMLKN